MQIIQAYKCPSCSKLYETEIEVTNCLVRCSENCNENIIIETCENKESMNILISYNEGKWSKIIDGKGEIYVEQDGYGMLIPSSKVDELCDGLQKFKTMWISRKILNKIGGDE